MATTLAKLSNFIPEGGIWMNTQRPEWNDANNALVGNGVSMVTLYYLRRFLVFFKEVLAQTKHQEVAISDELLQCYTQMKETLANSIEVLKAPISDQQRKSILDGLGVPASEYRQKIYDEDFSGKKSALLLNDLAEFIDLALAHLHHAIDANKRQDSLYHAYNLMTVVDGGGI